VEARLETPLITAMVTTDPFLCNPPNFRASPARARRLRLLRDFSGCAKSLGSLFLSGGSLVHVRGVLYHSVFSGRRPALTLKMGTLKKARVSVRDEWLRVTFSSFSRMESNRRVFCRYFPLVERLSGLTSHLSSLYLLFGLHQLVLPPVFLP